MSKKILRIIIVLTSVSFLAALITQLLWVRETGLLKKDKIYYGIFRMDDSVFVSGNFAGVTNELLNSPMKNTILFTGQPEKYALSVYFPAKKSLFLNEMIILPVMSGLFMLVLVFSFFFTFYFVIRQKKLSEIKDDFVNNMTHEFKTPIATISITSEILTKGQVIHSPEKVSKYARIIYDENTRLKNMVERILQIAVLDKDEFRLKNSVFDVHDIIMECIQNYKIMVSEKKGVIRTRFNAHQSLINADRDHLINILNNLLDNAVKYSPDKPQILLSTFNSMDRIVITVTDEGIGIAKENQEDVFKKFYRFQQGDIHDVKGFGIGLYYVKTMVAKMGGKIELKSELNKGSTFTLFFPVQEQ